MDIWALGCTLYYIIHKKDPFDGKDPAEIKKKILNFKLQQMSPQNASSTSVNSQSSTDEDQKMKQILLPILQACFNFEPNLRPTCTQLLQSVNQIIQQLKDLSNTKTSVLIGGLSIEPVEDD